MQASSAVRRLEVPRLSIAERDRRWTLVRSLMARDGIDVIVAPAATGAWDNMASFNRYLTTIGGNCAPVATVFPADGEVTVITAPVPPKEHWLGFQDWVTDIRPSFFMMTEPVIGRLRELSADRARIGLAGLAGLPRQPEGSVPHGVYAALAEAFPLAELVNATPLLEEARFVKSDEEIEALRRATGLVEHALDVLAALARPGVPENVLYARMLAAMGERGSDLPTMFLFSAGTPQPLRNYFQPTMRPLEAGDVISCEIEGKWAGYIGHYTCQATVGPVPDEYAAMFEVQQRAVERCRAHLVPGATLGEFIDIAASAAEGTPYRCQVILHGRGLGDDAPITVFGTQFGGQAERMKNWRLEANAVLLPKPLVATRDFQKWVCWGDPVVVAEGGGQRLGTRRPEIMAVG